MANPSLQIGNDNWAIKEDNLLGYSTAGTRFVPQPITMTRATLGTRVNPEGLVEDVELLGSELVTNGDFENNVIGWNKFKSNATESWNAGGYLDFTKTGESGRLGSDVSLETNKTYKISVNVISLGGILDLHVGISDFESPYSGNSSSALAVGVNTIYLTYPGSALSKGVYLQSGGTNYYGLTASIGSISVKEATIDNLPRVDYTDGTSSLLVEPQRTNLLTYSEDFSNAIYIKDSTVSVGTTNNVSPSGEFNATKIDVTASGRIYSNLGLTDTYATSVFIKAGTFAYFRIAGVQVDLVAKTNASGTIESLGNGWFRVGVAITGNRPFQIQAYPDGSYATHTTSGNYFIWGSQIEAASYPTSYIKTSGLTVTRNQETYTKTGISDKINSEEGVLFAEISALVNSDTTNPNRGISISDGSINNTIYIYFQSSTNQFSIILISGGTTQFTYSTTSFDVTSFNKVALKYKLNDFALWVNGVEVATDSSGNTPTGLSKLSFDNGAGNDKFFGKVKQLQIFKTALTDSELATLTT